mmetsp:Transcript_21353/g.44959  ORF Transcript_21353/g.44959 Transcript_21353/m.44959 type:complete len:334 (+) Transcript_21353:209-1210(+)
MITMMYGNRKALGNRSGTTIPGLLFLVAIVSRMATTAFGFSSMSSLQSRFLTRSTTTELHATKSYPPMSRDEVQAMLDTIPVYAVTEPNQEGLVLLKEKNNPKDIAYFFFSPDAANTVFSPLRKKENESSGMGEWSVSAYPLGLVWFELINEPEEGIEYRLLPDPEDLIGAQNLLREQQKQSKKIDVRIQDLFQKPFNEIPVFVDQFLRVTVPDDNDKRGRVPLYFGLKDLMDTVNQAIKGSSGEYQAAMSAVDLGDLIDEMMQESANDYRIAVLVPPTAGKEASPSPSPAPVESKKRVDVDDFQKVVEGKQESKMTNDTPIATPTAADDLWD